MIWEVLLQSRHVRRRINMMLRPLNLKIHDDPSDGSTPTLGRLRGRYNRRTEATPQAQKRLRRDHPALQDLRRRYADSGLVMASLGVWGTADRLEDLTMPYFRGDNAYLWQLRNIRRRQSTVYREYSSYIRSIDQRGLLGRLGEDGAFGCWTYRDAERTVISRDLLDSVNEICFLDRVWGLLDRDGFNVVDIGAGYGRLAHRIVTANPDLNQYYCVDAVPESTFLCEYYLQYRKISPKGQVVPLDRLDEEIKGHVDLAVNVHSFSEMPRAAIRGWLSWLRQRNVRNLFIVSNEGDRLLSLESDFSRTDAMPLLAEYGYRLVAGEPIIRDKGIRDSLGIEDHFLFFTRVLK
ncbi:putative sugar O-methyltransferase [Streptomyces sp. ICN988]|uniref:putative sugar O-methyltransferase n=1 Tax=Streptomyces sp. ICN988 TaxID=2983765 RepID=UPI0021E467FA|nr:putative sugar O-methyltransferase [Streptomyces sp. ICN988]MCV2458434.1 putative sugar O-methyltransferase [Streptomyces sp. ICN988]